MAVASLGIGILGYFAIGFGLQFGGLGLINPHLDYSALIWEWTPTDISWGTGWGVIGLKGFALEGEVATPAVMALFLSQIPWVATATLIPLLALRGRFPPPVSLLCGLLVSAVLYPIAGNWVWGGGWLANLGRNLAAGHGLVDFGGTGSIHLLGATVALAGILLLPRRPRSKAGEPAHLPPAHLPLLAVLGAGMVTVGLPAMTWANPLPDWNSLPLAQIAVSSLLAATGGVLPSLAYTWFATGRTDSLMSTRGLTAGVVAAAAGLPFVPPLYMLLIGFVAGVVTLLAIYVIDHLLRLDDNSAAVSIHGLPALWGLLAVGLFADGKAGQGYNGIGLSAYLGVSGQGVSGLLTGSSIQPDWPAQFEAQVVAAAAIFLFAFALTTLLLGPFAAARHTLQKARMAVKASTVVPALPASPSATEALAAEPSTSIPATGKPLEPV